MAGPSLRAVARTPPAAARPAIIAGPAARPSPPARGRAAALYQISLIGTHFMAADWPAGVAHGLLAVLGTAALARAYPADNG